MKDTNSKQVRSIKIEVVNADNKEINISTQLHKDETIEVLKECIKLLEREVSHKK